MKIGVLAFQGSVVEHIHALIKCGVETKEIRNSDDLKDVDGLIIPGGESTTMSVMLEDVELKKGIINLGKAGMPIYGTCAGGILLSKKAEGIENALGLIDMSCERNAYGRQINSFETDLEIKGLNKTFRGIFIRAPVFISNRTDMEVLGKVGEIPVMLKQKNFLITAFHPELTDDLRIHQYFLEMVKKSLNENN